MDFLEKNYNASSSIFGWQFQINAAILFFINQVKGINSIRVEGENEDIEISLSNGKKIFIQAKSRSRLGTNPEALSNFSDGLKTLLHASNKEEYEKLYFVTNYPNPIGGKQKQYNTFMGGYYIERKFDELSEVIPAAAKAKIKEVQDEYNLQFDTSRFHIAVIPFDGEIQESRERIISARTKEFLRSLSVDEGISRDITEIWQSDMFFNASNIKTDIELSKRGLIWPIVVLHTDLKPDDKLIDSMEEELDLELEDIEIILARYGTFINKKIEHFDFAIKVLSDYKFYRNNSKRKERKIDPFINNNWEAYKADIYSEDMDDELLETLIKVILKKLLNKQKLITKIVEEVNL